MSTVVYVVPRCSAITVHVAGGERAAINVDEVFNLYVSGFNTCFGGGGLCPPSAAVAAVGRTIAGVIVDVAPTASATASAGTRFVRIVSSLFVVWGWFVVCGLLYGVGFVLCRVVDLFVTSLTWGGGECA